MTLADQVVELFETLTEQLNKIKTTICLIHKRVLYLEERIKKLEEKQEDK